MSLEKHIRYMSLKKLRQVCGFKKTRGLEGKKINKSFLGTARAHHARARAMSRAWLNKKNWAHGPLGGFQLFQGDSTKNENR